MNLERGSAALRRGAPAVALATVADLAVCGASYGFGLGARDAQLAGFAAFVAVLWPLLDRRLGSLSAGRFALLALLALPLRAGSLAWGSGGSGVSWGAGLLVGDLLAGCVLVVGRGVLRARADGDGTPAWDFVALAALAYWLALRSVYLGLPQLLPDEAYHWTWSTHLDLSYLDHPPLTGWAIWLSTALLGKNELAVRAFAWIAGLATVGFLYGFGRDLYGRSVGLRTALLAACLPFYFAVGVVMMPDSLQFACWAGALYFASRAVLRGHGWAWLALGVCLGLGVLAKYTIGLVGIAVVLFVVLDPRSRRWLRRPEPYLGALIALLLLSPVLVWNADHDWASFSFQTTRRFQRSLRAGLLFLPLHGMLLLTPTAFAAAVWSLWPGRRGLFPPGDPDERRTRRFVWILCWVPLAPFLLDAIVLYPRAHWTAPAWLSLLPLVARTMTSDFVSRRGGRAARVLQRAWAPTLALLLVFYGLGLQYVVTGFPGVPYGSFFDRYFWKEAVPEIQRGLAQLARETGEDPVLGANSKWSVAASLSFYGPPEWQDEILSRHLFGEQASMWSFWNPVEPAVGRPLFLLGRNSWDLMEDNALQTLEDPGPIQEVTLYRDGVPLRNLYYRTTRRYKGPPARRIPGFHSEETHRYDPGAAEPRTGDRQRSQP